MSKIHLYAEVLTNIRQISLYATLRTSTNEGTTVDISSNKKVVTVTHDGESSSIYLPTEISGTAQVEIPTERKKEITLRLSIDDTSELTSPHVDSRRTEAPWSAKDLSVGAVLKCRSCRETILESGKVHVWQDLPSENWYEMMDYWHCHKPHEHSPEIQGHAAESKGYAANSRVRAKAGTGFVDISSFLLDATDCTNLQAVPSDDQTNPSINCSKCHSFVGWNDGSLGGHFIHKSRLLVETENASVSETFPTSFFICAQLLALIESQATRKFILHSGKSTTGYLLWVFNPDIYYSSSTRAPIAHRAMKVFYQIITNPVQMLDENTTTLEELRLPAPLLEDFVDTLADGTDVLPDTARKFQEWTVAILDLYEKHASPGMDETMLTQKPPPKKPWPEEVYQMAGIEGLLE